MPLLIDLKSNEKIIINGTVIENAGVSTKIRVHNDSNILRQKEILTQEEANTPATKVYFCLQCAYIFPDKAEHYLALFKDYLIQYVEAAPSSMEIVSSISQDIEQGQLYRALKSVRKLIKHEGSLVAKFPDGNDPE